MKIFNKIKSIFNRSVSVKDYVDPKTGKVTKSAIHYNKTNERYLKLDNDTCAMVIHPGGKVEIIFTRLYDKENQSITPEEETLMSIAMFLRQPGFADMLKYEFNKIATENISKLTEETNE